MDTASGVPGSTYAAALGAPTIQSRIIRLIAILLVPLLLVFGWMASQFADAQRRIIELERLGVASNLVQLLDRRLTGIEGILTGLGNSEALRMGDLEHFRRHADVIVGLPNFNTIELWNANGDIAVSTRDGSERLMPHGERAEIAAYVAAGNQFVSELHKGENGQPHTFTMAIPIEKQGKTTHVLAAHLVPTWLNSLFTAAGNKDDWIAAIVDRKGRFLGRSLDGEAKVGQQSTQGVTKVAGLKQQSGEFENVTLEGVSVHNHFEKSKLADWTAVVAVPKDIINAPFRRAMLFVATGAILLTVLSLALASLMASHISTPVRNLRDTAAAMIEGRTIPETPLEIAELNEVRSALKTAVSKAGHLAAIVASSGDAIMSVGLDGRVRSWNEGAEKLFGYSAEEMVGQFKTKVVPDDRADELQKHLNIILSGETSRIDTVRRNREGRLIDVSLDMAPIRDSDGKIVAMSSIIHDITDRKGTEKHQRFLMRELTHRSKNLLAIVQSMARQTARSAASLKDFETEYMQRLQGLAASHDLLVNQNWAGAPLNELIRRQVESFVEANRANLAIAGPDLMVSAKAAQAIGLALHELATNSMKYGALSTSKGKVSIDWEFHQTGDEPQRIRLKWEEHDGPPVTPPTRKGFGHFVIDRMATQSLNAKVDIDFRPEGLVWVLDAPASTMQIEPEFDAGDDDA